MSKICEICNKGTITGHNVSHSKRHTKRTWKPNIVKVKIEGKGILFVCARCRKSLSASSKKSKTA